MEIIAVAAGVLLLIGFICGYGVRALISRWHHAKARRRHFERMAEGITNQDRPAIIFQKGDSVAALSIGFGCGMVLARGSRAADGCHICHEGSAVPAHRLPDTTSRSIRLLTKKA
jgi:hypothetical protein